MKKVMYSLMIATTIVLTSCDGSIKNVEVKETKEVTTEKFACPMECEGDKSYDASGECPVCGMELVIIE